MQRWRIFNQLKFYYKSCEYFIISEFHSPTIRTPITVITIFRKLRETIILENVMLLLLFEIPLFY